MDDTFYLTNMSPQVGAGFNRNYWARLEQFVRRLTAVYKDVYVLTGPLWLPQRERDGKHYVRYRIAGPRVAKQASLGHTPLTCGGRMPDAPQRCAVLGTRSSASRPT